MFLEIAADSQRLRLRNDLTTMYSTTYLFVWPWAHSANNAVRRSLNKAPTPQARRYRASNRLYVPNLVDAIPLCLCGAWAPPIQRLRLLERMGPTRKVSAPTTTEDKWNHQQAFWTRGNPWDQNPRRVGGEPRNSSASPTPEASL